MPVTLSCGRFFFAIKSTYICSTYLKNLTNFLTGTYTQLIQPAKMKKGMKLTPSFAIANELAPILADLNLKLMDQESIWHNGKKSTKITIAGYSNSNKKFIVKEFLILSFDAKTIAKVVKKNWH